ncbi:MAG TPA: murein transglycosylase A [Desulfuromonadales bacterium]|nr:murein transglycosylase A [Desulfuromonadales bacterium]
MTRPFCWAALAGSLLMSFGGCAKPPEITGPPSVVEPVTPAEPEPEPAVEAEPLQEVAWSEVDGWLRDDPALAMDALLKSCRALRFRSEWQQPCARLTSMVGRTGDEIRQALEEAFVPFRLQQADGSPVGLLTGYYVPDLRGSRTPSADYPYPLYERPDDLLAIDLTDVYPSLSGYRLRGRLEGNRVIPYWDRDEIESPEKPLQGEELFWVADPVELFFLHIQGSGRILFEDGSSAMVNYADQNGHPYRSIGAWMIERGIMTRDQMSMQNIRAWARDNPDRVDELLGQNPSYVFFRDLGEDIYSPPGALGVPLTPGRSLAVDPRYIPLGAPVFLATTWPGTDRPLQRLMSAQDTGGAIKGRVRSDFFWGMGEQAGSFAGRTKQEVRLWLLLPREDGNTEL